MSFVDLTLGPPTFSLRQSQRDTPTTTTSGTRQRTRQVQIYIDFPHFGKLEIDFNSNYLQVYQMKNPRPKRPASLRVYECHVGISSFEGKVKEKEEKKFSHKKY